VSGVISGTAYGRPATLDVAGDRLTWRAVRGFSGVAENIVTTVHDVRFAAYLELRWSWAAGAIGVLGGLWLATEGMVLGIAALAIAASLLAFRIVRPRRFLVLEVGSSRLVLRVATRSAPLARALADRIDLALATGEVPASPPMLP
jgi:hypothetical protein